MKLQADEFTGKRFGKYEVLCRLTVGGMAEIFLGFPRAGSALGRPVVLKRILPEQREDPAALQMLIDEAKLTATLSHPNVAQVLDLEMVGEDVVLVIEFISGANLEEVVDVYKARSEPVPLGFVLAAVREAAQGLAHAHGHKDASGQLVPIIHRDVTPRNVMVDFNGAIKVLDFGIARAKGSERRTQAGMVRGTTAYMSPEQAVGKELDPRTDLFSLGIIAHELLTGQRLFFKGNPAQEMAAVYEAEIPLPSKANRRVPRPVDPVIMKALERKLDRRYQSALELIRDLALAAGSTMWTKERCAEMVRSQFSERQQNIEKLLARIPGRGVEYPDGPTLIARGPLTSYHDEDAPKTLLAQDPLRTVRGSPSDATLIPGPVPQKGSTPPREQAARRTIVDGTDPVRQVPTDPGRAVTTDPDRDQVSRPAGSITDTASAATPGPRRAGLSEEELFDDLEPPSRPRVMGRKPSSGSAPLPAPRAGLSSGVVIVAALLALVLGAAGGALVIRSMSAGPSTVASFGRVRVDADRPAELLFQGQLLGKTPWTGVLPLGAHEVQLKEGGKIKTASLTVEPNKDNAYTYTLDLLP